jgi:hypothetical protein
MTRYYTVCDFTPSRRIDRKWIRVYRAAPPGFLFHDTEGNLEVSDVWRALHRLSSLHTNAKQAIACRVDNQTIAATFSLAAFPMPRRLQTWEQKRSGDFGDAYLQTEDMTIWVFPDVSNSTQKPKRMSAYAFYEECEQLPKLVGQCPCPLISSGECLKENVLPKLPSVFTPEVMRTNYSGFEQSVLKTGLFKSLFGFEYVSTKTTTNEDFAPGWRPWIDHDFDLVPERKVVLSKRAKLQHTRKKYRELKCSGCAFQSTNWRTSNPTDCGEIHYCEEGISEKNVWTLLYAWYGETGFEQLPGFTTRERNYLIKAAGNQEYRYAIGNNIRKVRVILAGFTLERSNTWYYRVSAACGDLQRQEHFRSYSDLRNAIPELPETPDEFEIPAQVRLACAILGTHNDIHSRGAFGRWQPVHRTELRGDTVYSTATSTRYDAGSEQLCSSTDVKYWYFHTFGHRYADAHSMFKKQIT